MQLSSEIDATISDCSGHKVLIRIRKVEFKGSVPSFAWRESVKPFWEKTSIHSAKIRTLISLSTSDQPIGKVTLVYEKDGLKYSTTVSSKGSKSTTTVVRNVELDAANVPGLSSAVVSIPNGEVGPGAAKQGQYKNPEYFCYNPISYFEAEIEMAKYRIPQPSNNQK
uniref:NADH dehydrogenase [ubiquinone] flavoprotein 3, mitochondrial n=1 Tax=Timema bartmani TaxID=61472 RepID=A0A7R9F9R7_9NEOP|nr:unnamed protein product [Timema bartmani]